MTCGSSAPASAVRSPSPPGRAWPGDSGLSRRRRRRRRRSRRLAARAAWRDTLRELMLGPAGARPIRGIPLACPAPDGLAGLPRAGVRLVRSRRQVQAGRPGGTARAPTPRRLVLEVPEEVAYRANHGLPPSSLSLPRGGVADIGEVP